MKLPLRKDLCYDALSLAYKEYYTERLRHLVSPVITTRRSSLSISICSMVALVMRTDSLLCSGLLMRKLNVPALEFATQDADGPGVFLFFGRHTSAMMISVVTMHCRLGLGIFV
jgi:hypothetical protein